MLHSRMMSNDIKLHWLETYTPKRIKPDSPIETQMILSLKNRDVSAIQFWHNKVRREILENGWSNHVMVSVPSSQQGCARNGIYDLLRGFDHEGLRVKTDALVRTEPMQKSSYSGNRSTQRHLETIRVNDQELPFLTGQDILLVDDVATTNATLIACCEILRQARPKSITALALGRTLKLTERKLSLKL